MAVFACSQHQQHPGRMIAAKHLYQQMQAPKFQVGPQTRVWRRKELLDMKQLCRLSCTQESLPPALYEFQHLWAAHWNYKLPAALPQGHFASRVQAAQRRLQDAGPQ